MSEGPVLQLPVMSKLLNDSGVISALLRQQDKTGKVQPIWCVAAGPGLRKCAEPFFAEKAFQRSNRYRTSFSSEKARKCESLRAFGTSSRSNIPSNASECLSVDDLN